MSEFSFSNNIGDIVRFNVISSDGEQLGTLRGTVQNIIVGADSYGYAVLTTTGTVYVDSKNVIENLYSTKNFDVIYPGIEVDYFKNGFDSAPFRCVVQGAYIEDGRLYYVVRDSVNCTEFRAQDGLIRIVIDNPYNSDYCQ